MRTGTAVRCVMVAAAVMSFVSCSGEKTVFSSSEPSRCKHAKGFDKLRLEQPYRPYKMEKERKKRILNNYNALQIGMDEQQVWDLLGEPNIAGEAWAKESSKGCIGTTWDYWLDITHDIPNTKDQILQVFFSRQGKLHWAVPPVRSGLSEKGSPGRQE